MYVSKFTYEKHEINMVTFFLFIVKYTVYENSLILVPKNFLI